MPKSKPVLGIIRGSPRMAEAMFYNYFTKYRLKLIGDKSLGWIDLKKIPENINFIHSVLYPVWKFDPWTQILGSYHTHRSFQFLSNLEELVKDCDVLNISDCFYFYCWQAALLAKKYNKKLVTIVWETIPNHITSYIPPYSFAVNAVIKNTSLFIARSNLAKNYLLSIGADKNKIKVIYKGIDTKTFKFVKRTKRKNCKIKILYIGQLVESKGIKELLTAFQKLCKEFTNIELILIGRPIGKTNHEPLLDLVCKTAKKFPVILKQNLNYLDLAKIYKEADIYCQLSQDWKYLHLIPGGNEWFPYSVIEAMASGLPIVTTGVGGIKEQVGNIGNVIVKQKNAETVYQGLKKLILNKELRIKIGKKNRLRVEKMFDIKKQAEKTEQAILKNL